MQLVAGGGWGGGKVAAKGAKVAAYLAVFDECLSENYSFWLFAKVAAWG